MFNYHKAIKDIQIFNQLLIKETKDKYHSMQKKYDLIPSIQNNVSNGYISENNKSLLNSDNMLINGRNSNYNIQINKISKTETEKYYKHKNINSNSDYLFEDSKDKNIKINKSVNTHIFNQSSPLISVKKSEEKILLIKQIFQKKSKKLKQ